MSAKVENFAPDMDCVKIETVDAIIIIDRDEDGKVYITVQEIGDGSEMRIVLGQEGYTHKI